MSEEEFNNLKFKHRNEIVVLKNKLLNACTIAAKNTDGCYAIDMKGYCDKCVVENICPYENKNYSQ